MNKLLALALLTAALTTAACSSDSTGPTDDDRSAYQMCEDNGGTIVIHVDANGNRYVTCE